MNQRLWSRRELLKAGLAFGLLPQPVLAADHAFTFVVINDLHFRDARDAVWFEAVLTDIRKLRPAPDFCVLNGDLAESGTRAQLGSVHELVRTLRMPVYPIIGNHDFSDKSDRSAYGAIFGKRYNYEFRYGGCQFLAIDSTEGGRVYHTRISGETIDWVKRRSRQLDPKRPVILLTHFPLGRNWLRPLNAGAVLEPLKSHQLWASLGGHWHGATQRKAGDAILSTSRCCSWWRKNHDGSFEKGYQICRVDSHGLSRQFRRVMVPQGI